MLACHQAVAAIQASCTRQKQKSHLAVASCLCRRWVCTRNLAEWTGLEPATPGVTGRYSNQLNYHSWQTAFALFRAKCCKLGDPTGIRTPVLTVKG